MSRSTALVGREPELALLAQAVSAASGGRAGAVLVTGDAGIGKTRLLDEFADRARLAGARVLVGRCVRLTTCTVPFAPLLEVLRQAGPSVAPAEDLLSVVAPGAAPGTAAPGAAAPVTGSASREPAEHLARTRVFAQVVGLLGTLPGPGPLVLVVEDAHWADASSLDLLRFVLAHLHDEPVVLVLSCRDDELPAGHPRLPELRELTGRGPEVRLGPLSPSDVGVLVHGLRGEAAPAEVVSAVRAASAGNPLYVEELVAAGFPDRTLRDTRLRGLLLARTSQLGSSAREVLALVAVAGTRLEHELLEAVWDHADASLAAAVRECVDQHLLVVAADGEAYTYRQVLVRDAVHDELLISERRRLHLRLATGLRDTATGTAAGTASVEAASHWFAAGRWPEALATGLGAARTCAARYGLAEAHEHYGRVLDLWDRVPTSQRPAGLTRNDLLAEAAEAARLACDAPGAIALLEQALQTDGDEQQTVRPAALLERLAHCLWEAGDTAQAAEVCEHGVALLLGGPDSALHARLLAAQGRMLMLLGRYAESAPVCAASVAMARAVGAEPVELAALITGGVNAVMTGDTEGGLRTLRESCRLATRGSGLEVLVRAYGNLAAALGRLCCFAESLAVADEGLAELARRGLPASVGGLLLTNACESLVALGRWDDAEARIVEALGSPLPVSHLPFLHRLLGEVETARGRHDRAEASLAAAGDLASQLREPQYVAPYEVAVAVLAAERGEFDRASRAVAAALEAGTGSGQEDVAVLACLAGLRAAADEGARVRVLRTGGLDVLLAHGDHLWVRAQALAAGVDRSGAELPDLAAALAQCRAELARLHQADEAVDWAASAQAWRLVGRPYAVAGVLLRQAECLLRHKQGVAARPLMQEALEIARELGAAPLQDRLVELARRARVDLGRPERPRPASPAAGSLTDRELQVLQLLVTGSTNREIAGSLFISLKTVDNHVTHVLEKLQARNRVEAAAAGLRQGLVGPGPVPQQHVPVPAPAGPGRSPVPRRTP